MLNTLFFKMGFHIIRLLFSCIYALPIVALSFIFIEVMFNPFVVDFSSAVLMLKQNSSGVLFLTLMMSFFSGRLTNGASKSSASASASASDATMSNHESKCCGVENDSESKIIKEK